MLKTKIWINIKKDLNDESLKIYNSRKEFNYLPFKSLSPKNKKIKISYFSPKKEINEDKNSKRKNKKKLKKIIIKNINLNKTPIKKKYQTMILIQNLIQLINLIFLLLILLLKQ